MDVISHMTKLQFQIDPVSSAVSAESAPLQVELRVLVIAGWAGRDASAIEHHIVELEQLGVPRPSAVPLFYRVAANQLSQSDALQVVGVDSSGEVEAFIFSHGGQTYVSVASDHTDRQLETHSVAHSKQVCVKPVATHAWRLDEVIEHWDQILIRSWIEEGGARVLYQEGTLAGLRAPGDLIGRCFGASNAARIPDGVGMLCGTVPAKGGIRPSRTFEMEIEDPVLKRTIRHGYRCEELPIVS